MLLTTERVRLDKLDARYVLERIRENGGGPGGGAADSGPLESPSAASVVVCDYDRPDRAVRGRIRRSGCLTKGICSRYAITPRSASLVVSDALAHSGQPADKILSRAGGVRPPMKGDELAAKRKRR